MSDKRVGSGAAAPPSHYGTCGVCGDGTVWCMAGYWVHDLPDEPRDHRPVSLDPHRHQQADKQGEGRDGRA